MIEMIEVAKKISEEMAKNNLSYAELSKLTGISKSSLQRYVTGETGKMPIPSLELIAKALHVSPSYLIGWEEEQELDEDAELMEYLDMLRNRSECRMLLKTAKGATKAEVERNVAVIEAMIKHEKTD